VVLVVAIKTGRAGGSGIVVARLPVALIITGKTDDEVLLLEVVLVVIVAVAAPLSTTVAV
jgi:hypothetical protein